MEVNEFRVRAVTRFVLTHYQASGRSASCGTMGEFDNLEQAETVGRALAASVPGATFTPIETKTYADGTTATGIAPLPDLSPAEQAEAERGH